MRLSINLTDYSWPVPPQNLWDRLGDLAESADEAGIDTLWVADHLIQADPNSTPDSEMLEAYTTLGFLAARTRRIRLGTMVSAVHHRHPALLIKAVTTLDVLSGGRAWLGVGAGYHEQESKDMGLALPPVAERFERLSETLELAHQMWAGDHGRFIGSHHQMERPVNSPQALQRPRPPILVGGMGETKTLRLVAAYADACNLFDIPDGGQTITRKLSALARHCAETGRPYQEIDKTISTRTEPGESADQLIERCAHLAEAGITHVVLITAGPWTDKAITTLAATIPELERL